MFVNPELTLLTCILDIKKSAVQTIAIFKVCGHLITVRSDAQQALFECALREYVNSESADVNTESADRNRLGQIILYLIQTRTLRDIHYGGFSAKARAICCFCNRQLFIALLALS